MPRMRSSGSAAVHERARCLPARRRTLAVLPRYEEGAIECYAIRWRAIYIEQARKVICCLPDAWRSASR